MKETTLRIASTFNVDKPMSESEWYKKYKIGSRVPKIQSSVDMYHRGEYDFDKLVNIIKHGAAKPTWYERILGLKITPWTRR